MRGYVLGTILILSSTPLLAGECTSSCNGFDQALSNACKNSQGAVHAWLQTANMTLGSAPINPLLSPIGALESPSCGKGLWGWLTGTVQGIPGTLKLAAELYADGQNVGALQARMTDPNTEIGKVTLGIINTIQSKLPEVLAKEIPNFPCMPACEQAEMICEIYPNIALLIAPAAASALKVTDLEQIAEDAVSVVVRDAPHPSNLGHLMVLFKAQRALSTVRRLSEGKAAASPPFFGVQSQESLAKLIVMKNPPTHTFIKNKPIQGYQITSGKLSDLPEPIQKALGSVDQTKYTDQYLEANKGGMIALQMNGDTPDYYVISKQTLESQYKQTPEGQNLFKLVKATPVKMVKMSEVGYPVGKSVTIKSPWGEQTKPAGQDGWLVYDSNSKQYYMVNSDSQGLPINYIP